jgi:hypothetical protein
MHLRIILRHLGLRHTALYEILELSYFRKEGRGVECSLRIVIFIVFRGIFGPVSLLQLLRDLSASVVVKFAASGILVYSIYYITE